MVKKNYAVVTLDATGSMSGQEERVVTSINEYAESLPDGTHLTVFMFDSQRWIEFFNDKISNWRSMKLDDYKPGSMTPLYDSIAKSIAHAESLAKKGDRVMVMVDTDGYENASQEHTHKSCKALVDAKKEAGYEFLFMSGGIDKAQAITVGATGQSLSMSNISNLHTRRDAAYTSAGLQTASYFADGSATKDASFLEEEATVSNTN